MTSLEDGVAKILSLVQDEKLEVASPILSIEGMSGRKYRSFINNLICHMRDARYLEVGVCAGSTLCAAIHQNRVSAVGIDNWSEFGGPRETLMQNLKMFRTLDAEVTLIEADFRRVDFTQMGRGFNVYFYDGPHGERDHHDGLAMVLPALDEQFVFIVDDWNWERVRAGTKAAIAGCGLKVLYHHEIRTTDDDTLPVFTGKDSDWHNGYYISVLAKS